MAATKTILNILRPTGIRTTAIIVWVLRVIIGAVFIFSGWVKAVDIWGGTYKIGEYLGAWHIALPDSVIALLAGALAMAEFMAGVMILLGCFRRMAIRLTAIFMAVMTALTLYIWIADPVKDCGCFGDAIILSNAATFWKNIVIDAMLVVLWINNHRAGALVHTRLQWLAVIATAAFTGYIEYIGYRIQPVQDFRGFAPGTMLAHNDNDDNVRLVYAKDGIEQSFTADSLPDEENGWTYVRRATDSNKDNTSLAFISPDGEDITAEVIAPEGVQVILLIHDPRHYGRTRSAMANELYGALTAHGGDMFAVVGADDSTAAAWANEARAHYPVYTADETDIKMLARGNGALVCLRDGHIIWKQNTLTLPHNLGVSIMQDGLAVLDDPTYIEALRTAASARHAAEIYILVLAILMSMTAPPAIRNRLNAKTKSAKTT